MRIILAASACLLAAGGPAFAQDTAQQQPAPPARNDLVGPPQLRDFSLNGTVTRAAPAPAPVRTRPAAQAPAERRAPEATAQPTRTQPTREASTASARAAPAARGALSDVGPPSPAPSSQQPAASPPLGDAAADAAPVPAPAPADVDAGTSSHGFPILPWLIAALVAAAAAAWFFLFRNRPRESYAGFSFDLAPSPQPAPELPEQPRTVPRPKAAEPESPERKTVEPSPPAGVVSTRLRPWLEIEFKPDRGVVDENRAAIAFEIFVSNTGKVPARDVLLEASLFNAGPVQDEQIQLFFDNPVAKGDRIPMIPPGQRINVNTAVFMARDQVQPIEIEGRPLFVPMIAFNALYRWSGGEGQTSVSYLVGKETNSDKLAPFRLDLGPRIFRGLGAREHQLRVRK